MNRTSVRTELFLRTIPDSNQRHWPSVTQFDNRIWTYLTPESSGPTDTSIPQVIFELNWRRFNAPGEQCRQNRVLVPEMGWRPQHGPSCQG